ncbi:MAG: glycosyltransferase family 2 protein [Pseudomonadota bacterium]
MTSLPLVTIVIPTYNYGRFVEEAVRSAAAQTHPNTEIILVDDGSTDDTAVKLEGLRSEIQNLRVIATEHQGVSRARNCGTRAGRGQYVAYLDADDLWHPTKIEKQVLAMQKHANDPEWGAVYCLFRPIDENARVVASAPALETRGYFFARHLAMNPIGTGSGIMVRRDLMLELGGFDPSLSYCEDLDAQLRVSKHHKIELVREYLVGYRKHSGSASQHHLKMAHAALKVLGQYASDPAIPEELQRATYTAAQRYTWFKYLKGGKRFKAFQTLSRALMAEPRTTFDGLMTQAVPSIRRRVVAAKKLVTLDARPNTPHFYDLAPSDGVTLREPPALARLAARFKQFDVQMYERFVTAPDDEKMGDRAEEETGLMHSERVSPF